MHLIRHSNIFGYDCGRYGLHRAGRCQNTCWALTGTAYAKFAHLRTTTVDIVLAVAERDTERPCDVMPIRLRCNAYGFSDLNIAR